jgi:cobalt/nickel transport system permease protein
VSDTRTPEWLLTPEAGLCPCGRIGTRRRRSFVDKTISGVSNVMRQVLRADDVAARDGVLQRIDPRIKLVSVAGALIAVALVHHAVVMVVLYAAAVTLAALSAIPVWFFVKRVWLFIPIFTGIVVLPATLNVITDGEIVIPLGTWFGHEIGVTRQGLHMAALIVTRVAVSVSLVVLLTLTTSWTRLLASLRSLFVPRLFILVLGMTYRYVFHLLDAVDEMHVARKARTVSATANNAAGRRFVAASAGALFGKSQALAEEVHQAMTSRGWNGDARTMNTMRLVPRDVTFLAVCVVACSITLVVDRGLGK